VRVKSDVPNLHCYNAWYLHDASRKESVALNSTRSIAGLSLVYMKRIGIVKLCSYLGFAVILRFSAFT